MQRSKIIFAVLIFMGMIFTGFQCSSTELTSAKLYIQQKNYPKALESLHREVTKNPKSIEGYYLLGVVYGVKEEYNKMLDAFNKSLGIGKQYAKDISNQKRYYWAQLFNSGVGDYQKGRSTTKKDSSKLFLDKSAEAFKTALKLEPDSANTYKNLAFVYMSAQEYDNAIAPLKKLIEKQKEQDGYKYLGEIYFNKANKLKAKYKSSGNKQDSLQSMIYYEDAIKVLQKGRKYFPHNSDLLLILSNSYIGAHKLDVAIDAFKTGVKEQPDNKYYRYNYGVLLLGAKNYQAAAKQFKKAIEIDPNYQNAIYNLAVTYVKWGSGLSQIQNEKTINNPNAKIDTTYKQIYREALPYLEKSVRLKADDSTLWELLGKVYTILNYQNKAKAAYDRADKLSR